MIDVHTASKILDFGARIHDEQRAQEQLEGAVALHNILEQRGVAYLADEVGMGKTYTALGVLALFRHVQPDFRMLVIAPRENIQMKWIKEMGNFVTHNVRTRDLWVRAHDGKPVRPLVPCDNLREFAREVSRDPNRDFCLRLTSFSLPVPGRDRVDPEAARGLREVLQDALPYVDVNAFDLRNKQAFKDNLAKALCCLLPTFDLLIVDEGHNLKHGFGAHVSARNRVLALAMGDAREGIEPKRFPEFGPRAKRVLFLSATPVEETYRHLWNQLDIFGRGAPFEGLCRQDLDEDTQKAIVAQFLIRRVTSIRAAGVEYTKNLYRREWRRGGVHVYDEPIRIADPKQRLIMALVQKKVSELLGHERFNSSFQIGMLASFESFLETTRLKRAEPDSTNFDGADQPDDLLTREGIDVADVNQLARSYRSRFGMEMPHPKMDALVEALASTWQRGTKALVFVRRVASVKELKKKLDERYDTWLITRLERDLPVQLHSRLHDLVARYRREKRMAEARGELQMTQTLGHGHNDNDDHGGHDTFFAWFFRGEGPSGVLSGAKVQQRFTQPGTVYATFFEDNHVAALLGCRPGKVEQKLAQVLRVKREALRAGLQERSKRFLSRAKPQPRAHRCVAVQAAAIEWLKDEKGHYQELARIVWEERFISALQCPHATDAPAIGDWLEVRTFFTELRRRAALRARLWPYVQHKDAVEAFRETMRRAQMLATVARLGHAFIDLYVMTIRRLGSLELGAQETTDDASANLEIARIVEYLDVLERQMHTPLQKREWGAFDELAEVALHFDPILDVNAPEAQRHPLAETAHIFGRLLRRQQPVGGMAGQVNQTLVRQFRLPGYPLVLITTDLLQEGEDLHLFCSAVYHYGIAWTPSAMEQRTGRIDRVRSQTHRRLSALQDAPRGEDLLQVYFPHLEDTVEVLQVQRVLERMNVFLRLMHAGLITGGAEEQTINMVKEFARDRSMVPQSQQPLKSAFPVRPEHLCGDRSTKSASLKIRPRAANKYSDCDAATSLRRKAS